MAISSASIQNYAPGVIKQVVVTNDINTLIYNQSSYPTYISDNVKFFSVGSNSLLESNVSTISGGLIGNTVITSGNSIFSNSILNLTGNVYPLSGYNNSVVIEFKIWNQNDFSDVKSYYIGSSPSGVFNFLATNTISAAMYNLSSNILYILWQQQGYVDNNITFNPNLSGTNYGNAIGFLPMNGLGSGNLSGGKISTFTWHI